KLYWDHLSQQHNHPLYHSWRESYHLHRAEAMLATGAMSLQVANVVDVSEKTIYKYFSAGRENGVPVTG
ncbi:hypothetical protein WCT87_21840, partial [Pectobacterium brasiliense]